MRVPDEIRKCVAFVAYERKGRHRVLCGTAFFVALNAEGVPRSLFVITARHVIEHCKERAIDGKVYLRVNGSDSEDWLWSELSEWYFHPTDDRIDVAVIPLHGWSQSYDHKFYPTSGFATADIIARWDIGVGDQLYFPGLFIRRPGQKKNFPIIRLGNIAAMPEERIGTPLGEAHAYLAESRSIGGLSGSPVFVFIPSHRDFHEGFIPMGGGTSFLLGLVHGHWDAPTADDISFDLLHGEQVNMGIAVIVPADDIVATINHPEIAKRRNRPIEQHKSGKE